MQLSLLHRLKNNTCKAEIYCTPYTEHQKLTNALFKDLLLLFSSRPILSERSILFGLEKSILNYGIRVVEHSKMSGNKEVMTDTLAKNIVDALGRYERRISDIKIHRYNITAEKISFRIDGFFNDRTLSFIVSWKISISSYSLDAIL